MTNGPQLYSIDSSTHESTAIEEVDFQRLGFRERRDIQEWVANNPSILGEDLLIVGKEFSGFDRTNERLDLVAVDTEGRLVVIELKRDDSGADAHWQAIKYASYLSNAKRDDIVGMLADHARVTKQEANSRILQHLNEDDLTVLNNDQRIILASHRFAPEVTSASLWLNQKASNDGLIRCVQLTPYHDQQTKSLYVQATTIIPVPGVDDYVVGIGTAQEDGATSTFSTALARTYAKNQNDEVTRFLRGVMDSALSDMPDDIRPSRTSRWAGQGWTQGQDFRYYHAWYSKSPSRQLWANWDLSYRLNLFTETEARGFRLDVELTSLVPNLRARLEEHAILEVLTKELKELNVEAEAEMRPNRVFATLHSKELDGNFADLLATTLTMFIKTLTPLVDGFEEEGNEEDRR